MNDLVSEIDRYLKRLFPICRSITGNGNRETLRILQEIIDLSIFEIPSGTSVYDWVIPDEWNIRDAYIADSDGRRIVDFQLNNLHVVSYSEPINRKVNWEELKEHLHTHPSMPDAIPYRTSYYKHNWGFCLTHDQYHELERINGLFDVVIDSTIQAGSLSYGELLLSGHSKQEILISCYMCHPSMANDSLSGVLLTAFLARHLANCLNRRWSYRIVFIPETIGAIAYCARNESVMKSIDMGLVITTVGGPGPFGYKRSWQADHPINRLVEETFHEADQRFITYDFDIHGSDERQYSSPGFRINCATICKDRYYEYPQYHSSKDDLDLVNGHQIYQTYELYRRLIEKIEARRVYKNQFSHGEVMLSRHGLYPETGGAQLPDANGRTETDLILWLLFLCDGKRSLEDICHELNVGMEAVEPIVDCLVTKGLLVSITSPQTCDFKL